MNTLHIHLGETVFFFFSPTQGNADYSHSFHSVINCILFSFAIHWYLQFEIFGMYFSLMNPLLLSHGSVEIFHLFYLCTKVLLYMKHVNLYYFVTKTFFNSVICLLTCVCVCVCVCVSFLGPHPWHMEVPRLGVKLEL